MAFIRCVSGETYAETVLWENLNPTVAFEAKEVTLSDDITNYDLLRIEGNATISDDTYLEVYTTPTYLMTCGTAKTDNAGGCGLAASTGAGSTGSRYTRVLNASSSVPNKINFGSEFSMATSTSNSKYAIPTKIVGIKY